MSTNSQSSASYYFLADTSLFYEFNPLDFDIQGVHANFQRNPLRAPESEATSYLHGPLVRDYYMIYYVKSGTGVLTVNSNSFTAKEGDLLFTFPGTIISEYVEMPDPWEYYWIHLKSSCFSHYLKMLGTSEIQPFFKGNKPDELLGIFEKLNNLNSNTSPISTFQRVSLISKFLEILFENADSVAADSNVDVSNTYISQAIKYFEYNLHRKISINQFADSLGLSRSHFSRIFKQHMGISPQEYIIQIKIKKACEFLLLPNISITSVATSLGYDQFSFSRIFRQTVGLSPSEYQKRNSK